MEGSRIETLSPTQCLSEPGVPKTSNLNLYFYNLHIYYAEIKMSIVRRKGHKAISKLFFPKQGAQKFSLKKNPKKSKVQVSGVVCRLHSRTHRGIFFGNYRS